jgi:hypothetical protein
MTVKGLLKTWQEQAGERRSAREFAIRLPLDDAARVLALSEMFPGRSEADIVTDLLAAALDELERAMPYTPGERVVAEDEQGDPLYEDIGPTPRFVSLTKKYRAQLEAERREG